MVTENRNTTETATSADAGRPFSILIADDDRGNRESLAEVLAHRGFHTVTAADGEQAVEIVQVQLIHLVLFDMHMPRLTGLEAVNVLRQLIHRVLPAVLMTADATKDLMRQAFQAQVYSVIPKPVNTNIVVHTLTRALTQVYGPPQRPENTGGGAGPTPPPTTDNPNRPTGE
jgi:CheY-like chemotaxis protein